LKDIFNLKYKNIINDKIVLRRAKTISTSTDSKIIDIPLTDDIRNIINYWGNKPQK